MRLEAVIEQLIKKHKGRIKPAIRNVTIPKQLNLFSRDNEEETKTSSERKVAMGRFYERLTAGIFGGQLSHEMQIPQNSNGHEEDEEDLEILMSKPDVVDNRTNKMYEAKACRAGHHFILSDYQLRAYSAFQAENPPPQITFVLYRHRLNGISSYQGSREELYRALTKKTLYCILLPLSIVLRLNQEETRSTGFVYRYFSKEGREFEDTTVVYSSTATSLFRAPASVISGIGLNADDFVIQRKLSPKKFTINRTPIVPFPIVIITDKDHETWTRDFKEKYRQEVPI